MGGCASKPKDLDTETVPAAPVETEPETLAQEVKDGDEKKEEALVEVSEAAPEAPKTEEEPKPEEKLAVPVEVEVKVEAAESVATA